MEQALYDVEVSLKVENGTLTFCIMEEKYNRVKSRKAGRKRKIQADRTKKETVKSLYDDSTYERAKIWRYSDGVYMMQTMTNQQICEKMEMKIATYYRHKKSMRESEYYKQLDRNKLCDKDYRENVPGNYAF